MEINPPLPGEVAALQGLTVGAAQREPAILAPSGIRFAHATSATGGGFKKGRKPKLPPLCFLSVFADQKAKTTVPLTVRGAPIWANGGELAGEMAFVSRPT